MRVRLELSARELGTDPPPSRCHIRAHQTGNGWVLLLWTPHGPTEAIRAWARALTRSEEIVVGEIGERTIGFQCDGIPQAWETLFGLFGTHHLIMDADGTTLTHIEGPREEVGELLTGMDLGLAAERVRVVPENDERMRGDVLTEEQEHAIAQAAALGYFEIPRGIQLGELAEELGTSTSALSELLRRAQARLVSVYLSNELGGVEAVLDLDELST